jgi:hypothetical protein
VRSSTILASAKMIYLSTGSWALVDVRLADGKEYVLRLANEMRPVSIPTIHVDRVMEEGIGNTPS